MAYAQRFFGRWLWRTGLLGSTLLFCSAAVAQAADDVKLGRTMAWSAYNLGTTGYNQAVAIGKVMKDHYNVNLRVVPGKNDVSRLLPLTKKRVQFSANGIATYFAQEGVFQFGEAKWGPLPLRIVMMSYGETNQALGVAADLGIKTYADLRGKRVPYVRGAPALNVPTTAFLACGGLTWDDVKRVDFPGYAAMWTGAVNGQVDAAYANTVSGPTRKLEASPRGIYWPPAPHADKGCWDRMLSIVPFLVPHHATRGAAISTEQPHEGATYPYPLLIALDDQKEQLVHDLAKVLHLHYDEYKDADPGAIGWALDRQIFQWTVPFHAGAVRYFKSVGVWTDADDAHNNQLLKRQAVLGEAWRIHQQTGGDKDAWYAARAAALTANGLDPVWQNPE
ncbi:MAG: TAXI family TRAP transporter solute-binding subunit [Pseudomonadota bacterium]